jgi:glycosyltransferase involved in cell wall biosynthesis
MQLRSGDQFTLVVQRGSEKKPLLEKFLARLGSRNWRLVVEEPHHNLVALRCLFGLDPYCTVRQRADVYLNMDLDYLGPKARPLLCSVADLSCIFAPKHSSLKWHGVRMRRHGLRLMARYADRVVAVSDFTRKDLEKYDRALSAKVTVIHNSIDEEWFAPRATPAAFDRSPVKQKDPYWIWWGYVTRRKNVENMLQAYATLRQQALGNLSIPNLLLIGQLGHDSGHLPHLIQNLDLSGHVAIHPFQPLDVLIPLVDASRGLIFPSYYEGFGLPVIEAMALGKPVLVSNRTALPEVGGGLAMVADPDDSIQFSAAMARMTDERLRTPAAVEARKAWARNFTHEAAAKKYDDLISSMLL